MARIEGSIEYVLQNEGGYTNDAQDAGGATNWGITHADLARWRRAPVSNGDVKSMTKAEAEEIYKAYYWAPLSLDGVEDQSIATCIFDTGVNRGLYVGASYAQRVCNELGSTLAVDGKIGPISIAAINSLKRRDFIADYYAHVKAGYDSIVAQHPSQRVFYNGWMNRARKLLTLIA